MGNSTGEVGEGARGCREEGAGWGMEGGVGSCGKSRRWEEYRQTVSQTDRERNGGEGRL